MAPRLCSLIFLLESMLKYGLHKLIVSQMNGYEVCTQLKADAALQDIPVIFISALNEALPPVTQESTGIGGRTCDCFLPGQALCSYVLLALFSAGGVPLWLQRCWVAVKSVGSSQ